MGLVKCFTAEDLLAYDRWNGTELATYNPWLIAAPRVYREELLATHNGAGRPGAVWAQREPNRWGESTINFLGTLDQIAWPSWSVGRWKLDGQFGRALGLQRQSLGTGVVLDLFAVEPSGNVWWFGLHASAYYGGAVLMDVDSMEATSTVLALADFPGASGGISDFAVDVAGDRVWIRSTSSSPGQVSVYRYSTKEKLHDIWAPNATNGIVLTHDGFVYLADELEWLLVYDYDGRLHNAFRNPHTTTPPGGVAYGWDPMFKRLLRLEGSAVAADGASTLRVEAYYPTPEAAILTPPIPRQVPRKGRTITVLSRLCGIGAEALAGRAVTLAGDAGGAVSTDVHGDVVARVTPGAAGVFAVEVTAE